LIKTDRQHISVENPAGLLDLADQDSI